METLNDTIRITRLVEPIMLLIDDSITKTIHCQPSDINLVPRTSTAVGTRVALKIKLQRCCSRLCHSRSRDQLAPTGRGGRAMRPRPAAPRSERAVYNLANFGFRILTYVVAGKIGFG